MKDRVKIIREAIKDIEIWKGDAYQQDDEVDRALNTIKLALADGVNESCPHCEEDSVVLNPYGDCPHCKKQLIACAICDVNDCDTCKHGCNMTINTDEVFIKL